MSLMQFHSWHPSSPRHLQPCQKGAHRSLPERTVSVAAHETFFELEKLQEAAEITPCQLSTDIRRLTVVGFHSRDDYFTPLKIYPIALHLC